MPPRWDYVTLATVTDEVAKSLRPAIARGDIAKNADTILIDKGWRGTRPINEMNLSDRIIYRAIVDHLAKLMPPQFSSRPNLADVNGLALGVPGVKYIVKSDVASYYEFIDHEILENELVAQSGDELASEALTELLSGIMGRRVGIPQIHQSSDVLGDTYIDPVRRRMVRRGYAVHTFSDDFRISCANLGEARNALDLCATEVRRLGLILNERKTFTYRSTKFQISLSSFKEAEERLLADSGTKLDDLDLDTYGIPTLEMPTLSGIGAAIDDEDALGSVRSDAAFDSGSPQARAAVSVWEMWLGEEESEDAQSQSSAAATQALLGRVLPRLGAMGFQEPLAHISLLMRFEPALTPQVFTYLANYCQLGPERRSAARDALDGLVREDILSTWQKIWAAQAAGGIQRAKRSRPHHEWLQECTRSTSSGLASTASASLARLGLVSSEDLLATLDQVTAEWRPLVLWGLARISSDAALSVADSTFDRLLIRTASGD